MWWDCKYKDPFFGFGKYFELFIRRPLSLVYVKLVCFMIFWRISNLNLLNKAYYIISSVMGVYYVTIGSAAVGQLTRFNLLLEKTLG